MGEKYISCIICSSDETRRLTVARGNRDLDYIAQQHPVVVCARCGLTYLNPQQDDEDYERYYQSADYKAIITPPKIFLRRHAYRRIQAGFVLDTLKRYWPQRDLTDLSAIDIGCGPGVLLYHLAEAGLKAAGLEASTNAADYAEYTLGLSIRRGSIYDRLLPESAFDLVVSTAAVEHFTDPLRALNAMKRCLKPDGLMYVNTPDLLGMVLKKGEANWFKFVHTYYFTEVSLSNLFEKTGMRVIRSWTMPPQLAASVIYPGNYCSGELNIIAVNDAETEHCGLRGVESFDKISAAYQKARRRDRLHAFIRRLARQRPVALMQKAASRVIRPTEVFAAICDADGSVRPDIFPPICS